MSVGLDLAAHWDNAYAEGEVSRSWSQLRPEMSLKMLDASGVTAADGLIDVGGGAARLVDALVGRGFLDITVLDISTTGIRYAQQRLGAAADDIQWLVANILTWEPGRRYRAWHDRAVFHFLTSAADRRRYLRALETATEPDAIAVFGVFAPQGPQQCSGLPVARYSAAALAAQLGTGWTLERADHEEHVTPAGVVQPFTWATLRKLA
jgi:trans-aconitate methyltransferase